MGQSLGAVVSGTSGWDCACGQRGITSNFCPSCGARRPGSLRPRRTPGTAPAARMGHHQQILSQLRLQAPGACGGRHLGLPLRTEGPDGENSARSAAPSGLSRSSRTPGTVPAARRASPGSSARSAAPSAPTPHDRTLGTVTAVRRVSPENSAPTAENREEE